LCLAEKNGKLKCERGADKRVFFPHVGISNCFKKKAGGKSGRIGEGHSPSPENKPKKENRSNTSSNKN